MSAAGSYPRRNVKIPSRPDRRATGDSLDSVPGHGPSGRSGTDAASGDAAVPDEQAASVADRVDLSGLSVAGITRRRLGFLAASLVAIWVVAVFARQVGDAGAAASQAARLAQDNAALAAEVQSLQGEVELIVRPDYIAIQARAHGLGAPHEIAFTLAPSVAEPVDGAPGSAAVRLGAHVASQSPLESWLSLLFGPGG